MVATSKNHRKTIDGNGQTAKKTFNGDGLLKTIENLQWSLQRDQRWEKQRRNESKAITNFFRPHAISKPERKEIDEAVIDYFIARSEPFRAVENQFFRHQ